MLLIACEAVLGLGDSAVARGTPRMLDRIAQVFLYGANTFALLFEVESS